MNIALCLTGHVRTYDNCKDSLFKCIINEYMPDVFIQTWDEMGHGLNGRPSDNKNEETVKKILQNSSHGNSSVEFKRGMGSVTMDIFENLYPKKLIIENYDVVEPHILQLSSQVTNKYSYDYPPNFISAQRQSMCCFELLELYEQENDIQYDIVIKSRFDILYNSITLNLNTDKLHVPNSQSYGIFSDIFGYSNKILMKKYLSFFNKIPEYIKENMFFNPHHALREHINKENVEFIIDDSLQLDILR